MRAGAQQMTAAAVQREKARLVAAFARRGGDIEADLDLISVDAARELEELIALRGR